MDRLRKLWQNDQPYEPLSNDVVEEEEEGGGGGDPDLRQHPTSKDALHTFSYIEYSIFFLLGISMLWAWNMFLAAGPYFQRRFQSSPWLLNNFQAAEISVSTVTNLVSMLVLTRLQAHASYPKRIISSLFINMVIFTLLAISTSVGTAPGGYFGFLMVMIFTTSLATGLCGNGIFAYVAGFGQPRYTQGIMMGQAVAGVLPCIAQIVSVLGVQGGDAGEPSTDEPPPVRSAAALAYFLTATAIAVLTLIAFIYLLAHHRKPDQRTVDSSTPDPLSDASDKKSIPLLTLFRKTSWLASAVFITFAITMFFPVFTQRIHSVLPPSQQGPFTQPATFIPLAFLFWNTGDLLGRLITAVPALSLVHRPKVVLVLSIARLLWVGLYHLCNISGRGAVVESDFFYLVVVQLLFGLSNGYVGSTCMIGAAEYVDDEEREAAGGFMGLMLVGGLTAGSLLSFFAAGG